MTPCTHFTVVRFRSGERKTQNRAPRRLRVDPITRPPKPEFRTLTPATSHRMWVTGPSGIPAPDVKITCRYLIIRDFGVDWRHIKEPTKREPLLLLLVDAFETDPSLLFRIVGYIDCLGTPATNTLRRKGRTHNVRNLLGVSARFRVMSVGGAPLDTYLTDNSTVQAERTTVRWSLSSLWPDSDLAALCSGGLRRGFCHWRA